MVGWGAVGLTRLCSQKVPRIPLSLTCEFQQLHRYLSPQPPAKPSHPLGNHLWLVSGACAGTCHIHQVFSVLCCAQQCPQCCPLSQDWAGTPWLPAALQGEGHSYSSFQQSLGWEGKKRSYKSRKTLLLHKMNDTFPSLATADSSSLHSRSNSRLQHTTKHTGPDISLLGQVHAAVHTGGLFSLLSSYTPLKQKVWAYKYCAIKSYSVYCMLSVAFSPSHTSFGACCCDSTLISLSAAGMCTHFSSSFQQ